jgi:ribonucleoside-diphosphate reductase beta chain
MIKHNMTQPGMSIDEFLPADNTFVFKHLDSEEPILKDNLKKYVIYPIDPEYADVWAAYKKAEACFWVAEEIDLNVDIMDWQLKLNDKERDYVKLILAFFAASDGIVNENLATNFIRDVKKPEARSFYGFQIAIENIHAETYSLLIDTLIKDAKERDRLFNAIENVDGVKLKAQWALKWINNDNSSFAERIVAFAAVEGIHFSGSFCTIFWLKKRGLMPGLCFSNELISRDEGMHCDFACLIYSKLKKKLPKQRVLEIVCGAVSCEIEFIKQALPYDLTEMNVDLMCKYIKFVADRLLLQLGCDKFYNCENPFDWMELISLRTKVNNFEKRNPDYLKGAIAGGSDGRVFCFDEDF